MSGLGAGSVRSRESAASAEQWGGTAAMADAAARAASTAVRALSPGRDREDVWASARAAAWEAMASGRVATWAGVHLVARQQATVTLASLRSWAPEWDVRRSGGRRPEHVPGDVIDDVPVLDDGPGLVEVQLTRQALAAGEEAPSPALVRLREVLDDLTRALIAAGMPEGTANASVDLVIEFPEAHRGPRRARQALVRRCRMHPLAAAALVTLVLGYPARGIPGLVARELRGEDGWGHPSVPLLVAQVVASEPRAIRGAWAEPAEVAA